MLEEFDLGSNGNFLKEKLGTNEKNTEQIQVSQEGTAVQRRDRKIQAARFEHSRGGDERAERAYMN